MRAVVTRVKSASVEIGGEISAKINRGFLVLLGVTQSDTPAQAVKLAEKITGLRVFEDGNGKMNLSLSDSGGGLLVVSNFTLYGSCKKGRRPDFLAAAGPEQAVPLYERFIAECERLGFPPKTGSFGADMQISSVNDGPVTLFLDTDFL